MKDMSVRTMTAAALCVAVGVIFSFLRIPLSNITEITLTGIPIAVGGCFFGPAVGAIIGALIDVAGYFVHPTGPFFPGFTISNALIGVIYGLFLWKRWYNTRLLIRITIAHLIKTILISLGLNILWLSFFYGMPFKAVFMGSLVKEAINFAIEVALIYFVIRALSRLKI